MADLPPSPNTAIYTFPAPAQLPLLPILIARRSGPEPSSRSLTSTQPALLTGFEEQHKAQFATFILQPHRQGESLFM